MAPKVTTSGHAGGGRGRGRGGGRQSSAAPPATPARVTRSQGTVNVDMSAYPEEKRRQRSVAKTPGSFSQTSSANTPATATANKQGTQSSNNLNTHTSFNTPASASSSASNNPTFANTPNQPASNTANANIINNLARLSSIPTINMNRTSQSTPPTQSNQRISMMNASLNFGTNLNAGNAMGTTSNGQSSASSTNHRSPPHNRSYRGSELSSHSGSFHSTQSTPTPIVSGNAHSGLRSNPPYGSHQFPGPSLGPGSMHVSGTLARSVSSASSDSNEAGPGDRQDDRLSDEPDGEPDDEPDNGAADGMVNDFPPAFWPTFWKQVREGFRYFSYRRAQIALVLAGYLLVQQLCSAPKLCDEVPIGIVVASAFRDYFWSYAALWLANLLAISGIYDLMEGAATVASKIGRRDGRRERSILNDWTAFRQAPRNHLEQSLGPFALDVAYLLVEPALLLALTFIYGDLSRYWPLSDRSSPIRLVCVNAVLHLVKWLCQTIDIVYRPFGALNGKQRPLVILFLVISAIFSELLSKLSTSPKFENGHIGAQHGSGSEGYSCHNLTGHHNIGNLFTCPARTLATVVNRMTGGAAAESKEPSPIA